MRRLHSRLGMTGWVDGEKNGYQYHAGGKTRCISSRQLDSSLPGVIGSGYAKSSVKSESFIGYPSQTQTIQSFETKERKGVRESMCYVPRATRTPWVKQTRNTSCITSSSCSEQATKREEEYGQRRLPITRT